MLPFGDEPGEKDVKPLNFLSSRHAAPKRKPAVAHLFGPEGAERESVTSQGVAKSKSHQPFQDEEGESETDAPTSLRASGTKRVASSVFGDEGSEDESTYPTQPFRDEGSETELSSNDEKAYEIKKETVFTVGWSSVSTFRKATFWRENMTDVNAKRSKRAYDNTNRVKKAQYLKNKTKGAFKRNGVNPARLQKLIGAHRCSCAFVCT